MRLNAGRCEVLAEYDVGFTAEGEVQVGSCAVPAVPLSAGAACRAQASAFKRLVCSAWIAAHWLPSTREGRVRASPPQRADRLRVLIRSRVCRA